MNNKTSSTKPSPATKIRPSSKPWQIYVLSLFPETFPGPLASSLTGKGLSSKIWQILAIDLKKFAPKASNRIDDKPFGGGSGMVILASVIDDALSFLQKHDKNYSNYRKIYLSANGQLFNQNLAYEYIESDGLIILCGRYEGVDQRVIDAHNFEVVSMGDFVVTNGDIVGLSMIDACVRLLPKVIGNPHSLCQESFSSNYDENLVEYPHYTRPSVWQGKVVPEVLISGNHQEIVKWRKMMSEQVTKSNRNDLWTKYQKSIKNKSKN